MRGRRRSCFFLSPYLFQAYAAPAVVRSAVFRRPARPVPLLHAPTASAVAAMAVFLRPAEPAQAMFELIRVTATARAVPEITLRTITLSSHPALSIGLFDLSHR